jgi:hypothetical protein
VNFISVIKSIFGAEKIVSGTILSKNYYPAETTTTPDPTMIGGSVVVGNTSVGTSESWSLTVDGKDKSGAEIKEEIYVDELTWNNAEVGDPWPIRNKD